MLTYTELKSIQTKLSELYILIIEEQGLYSNDEHLAAHVKSIDKALINLEDSLLKTKAIIDKLIELKSVSKENIKDTSFILELLANISKSESTPILKQTRFNPNILMISKLHTSSILNSKSNIIKSVPLTITQQSLFKDNSYVVEP